MSPVTNKSIVACGVAAIVAALFPTIYLTIAGERLGPSTTWTLLVSLGAILVIGMVVVGVLILAKKRHR